MSEQSGGILGKRQCSPLKPDLNQGSVHLLTQCKTI